MLNVDKYYVGMVHAKGKKRAAEKRVGSCMPCDTFDNIGLVIYEKRNNV